MRNFFRIALIFLILGSCEQAQEPLGTDWEEGVVYYTGAPEADGCGWLILKDGESFEPVDLSVEFKKDGLDIWFKANYTRDYYRCGLAQSAYKIIKMNEVIEKPWKVRFLSDYPGRETSMDMFYLDSVFVDQDSLRMLVRYSGGCAIHQFNLWALENGREDSDLHLMLEHIGNDDPCEALPSEWLSFSLAPLRESGKNETRFWLRGSPIMSSLYGEFIYKY